MKRWTIVERAPFLWLCAVIAPALTGGAFGLLQVVRIAVVALAERVAPAQLAGDAMPAQIGAFAVAVVAVVAVPIVALIGGVIIGIVPGLVTGLAIYRRAKKRPVSTVECVLVGSLSSAVFALCLFRSVNMAVSFAGIGAVATLSGLGFGKWGGFIREVPQEPASPA